MPPTPEIDDRRLLGSRIRQARERQGWSQSELAHAVGLGSFQIVSAIENGQREVKAWELFKIASSLHLSLDSLLGDEKRPEPVLLWRDQPESGFKEIEARFIERCSRYALLEQWCGVSPLQELKPIRFLQPEPTFLQVGREAENVRDSMKLGGRPACSLAKTLQEDYGVKIFYEGFGDQGAALSAKSDFGYGVLINSNNAPWRRNFSLAHELFHLLTFDTWKSPRQEKLADAFAATLLLPMEPLLGVLRSRMTNGKLSFETLVETAIEFDVSIEALLWRTVNLNMTKKEAVESALQNSTLRTLDKLNREWSTPDTLPERYTRLCYTAFRMGKMGRAMLAQFLEKSLVDLVAEMNEKEEEELSNDGETEIAVVGC